MKLIAEIKKASPHDGLLAEHVDPTFLASEYTRLGASAISVVTAKVFQGNKDWIKEVRASTKLPILRKDFITHVDDLKETADLGADWVLLIGDMLLHAELDNLTFHANQLGLKPVVEVNNLFALNNALMVDTNRILINNRNLVTGKVNIFNTVNLINLISDKYELTTASGYGIDPNLIGVTAKIEALDYILIGSMLMKSKNLEDTFKIILEQCQKKTTTISGGISQ